MFLEHQNEKDLKQISLDEFEESLMKHVQPDRLNPEGLKKCENSMGYKFENNYINLSPCDSQNSENK